MRKIVVFVLFFSVISSFSFALSENDLNLTYATTNGSVLFIRASFKVLPKNSLNLLLNVAVKGMKKEPRAKKILVDFYQDKKPIVGVQVNTKDLKAYLDGKISNSEFLKRCVFYDLRSNRVVLSEDFLNNYNTIIENIEESSNVLRLKLLYMGEQKQFLSSILPMMFDAVFYNPSVDRVIFRFELNGRMGFVEFSAKTNDILDAIDGKMPPKEFGKRIVVKSVLGKNQFLAKGNLVYRYIGCFRDRGNPFGYKDRDVNAFGFNSDKMTVEICVNECARRGYKFAALQYSQSCMCGNSYGKFGKANNCNMTCKGKASEVCGGSWANSIYEVVSYTGKRSGYSRGIEVNTDRFGSDYRNFNLPYPDYRLCRDACMKNKKCKAWTYVKPYTLQGPQARCWLKNSVPKAVHNPACVSGVKH